MPASRYVHARLLRWAGVATAALIALTACSGSGSPATPGTVSVGPITASGFRVNEPTVPERTGAFGTITNSGTSAIRLTGVGVPASMAASASVHETVTIDGETTMRELADGIPVPARGAVVLQPGGLHVMLMKPTVTVGQRVPLTLTFSDGTTLTVEAPVMAPSPGAVPSPSGSM